MNLNYDCYFFTLGTIKCQFYWNEVEIDRFNMALAEFYLSLLNEQHFQIWVLIWNRNRLFRLSIIPTNNYTFEELQSSSEWIVRWWASIITIWVVCAMIWLFTIGIASVSSGCAIVAVTCATTTSASTAAAVHKMVCIIAIFRIDGWMRLPIILIAGAILCRCIFIIITIIIW